MNPKNSNISNKISNNIDLLIYLDTLDAKVFPFLHSGEKSIIEEEKCQKGKRCVPESVMNDIRMSPLVISRSKCRDRFPNGSFYPGPFGEWTLPSMVKGLFPKQPVFMNNPDELT
jgi:hypothetical protein